MTTAATTTGVSQASPSDVASLLMIENACFSKPWNEHEFRLYLHELQHTNCRVWRTIHGEVIGFIVYETTRTRFEIYNIAVSPVFWGDGIGSELVRYLTGRLVGDRRTIRVDVDEDNLNAQLFFRAMNFRATEIIGGLPGNCDLYRFEYEGGVQ